LKENPVDDGSAVPLQFIATDDLRLKGNYE